MKKLVSIIVMAAMSLSVFTACGESKNNSSNTSTNFETVEGDTTFGLNPFAERQTLRVGYFAGSPLSLPWYIADQEGFFDELNIDVEYETFTNGPAMIEANSDWDVAGTGIGGALTAMIGYDIKTIGISDYEENVGLFVREDSEIAKNPDNPESWKGTTWLYPNGTTAQPVLAAKLGSMGLGLNDIKSVNMDISSALTAFIGGEGDGLGVWNAIAFNAEDEGYIRVTDAGQLEIPTPCATFATDEALANKEPLIVTAYTVFYKTVDWIYESDENMKKASEYYLANCEEEGIACDESLAERIMEVYKCPGYEENYNLLTEKTTDYAGKYSEEITKAENDFLYLLDYFISENKYTEEDRTKLLDGGYVDSSIALKSKELMDSLNK